MATKMVVAWSAAGIACDLPTNSRLVFYLFLFIFYFFFRATTSQGRQHYNADECLRVLMVIRNLLFCSQLYTLCTNFFFLALCHV